MASDKKQIDLELILLLLNISKQSGNESLSSHLLRKYSRSIGDSLDDPELLQILESEIRTGGGLNKRQTDEVRNIFHHYIHDDFGYGRDARDYISSHLEAHDSLKYDLREQASQILSLRAEIENVNSELETFRKSASEYLWLMTAGIDIPDSELLRYVPLRLYVADPLPNPAVLTQIQMALENFLSEYGFNKSDEFPPESGSWWKRIFTVSKDRITSSEVSERLKKAERATELAVLDKPQAEANNMQAQGAAALIESLKDVESACIQAGSLLVVKNTISGTASVSVKTLTPMEIKTLEENQSLLHNPNNILDCLQQMQLEYPNTLSTEAIDYNPIPRLPKADGDA